MLIYNQVYLNTQLTYTCAHIGRRCSAGLAEKRRRAMMESGVSSPSTPFNLPPPVIHSSSPAPVISPVSGF